MGDYMERRHQDIVNSLLPKPVTSKKPASIMATKHGSGLANRLIDSLPFPLHLPGYNYAGPGTPLERHLEAGVKPTNKLDEAAMYHDIAYSKTKDTAKRSIADRILENKAWERVKATDATLGEKGNAWLVTNAMKLKRLTGQGVSQANPQYTQYRINLDDTERKKLAEAVQLHRPVTVIIRNQRTKDAISNEIQVPLTQYQVQKMKNAASRNVNVKLTFSKRQLEHMSKEGGFLPALPALIAASPAVTAVVTSLFKAYNDKKTNDRLIDEKIRHNRAIEEKSGEGVYLRRKPTGNGIFLRKKPAGGSGVYLRKKPVTTRGGDSSGKGIYLNKKPQNTKGNGLLEALLKKKKLNL